MRMMTRFCTSASRNSSLFSTFEKLANEDIGDRVPQMMRTGLEWDGH